MTQSTEQKKQDAMSPKVWTPRERIHAALENREADRVPLAFAGSYYGPLDSLYLKLLDVLGLPFEPERQFRSNKGHTINFHDDRLLEAMDIDCRYVWLGSTDINSPDFSQSPEGTDVEADDLYGVGYCRTGYQVQVKPGAVPIHCEDIVEFSPDEIEAYKFPEVDQIIRLEPLAERVKYLGEETDYAVVARSPNSFGLFEQACHLIGHENLYMGVELNKPVVHAVTRRIKEFFMELYDAYLTVAGEWIDVIELPGDDYSGTGMVIVSPDTFYEFYLEPWKEIVALIRQKAPKAKILFHSDGVIQDYVACFRDAGGDVVHCLETAVGNDIEALKNDPSLQDIAYWGALDVKSPMQKGREATEADVNEKMRILEPGGGGVGLCC